MAMRGQIKKHGKQGVSTPSTFAITRQRAGRRRLAYISLVCQLQAVYLRIDVEAAKHVKLQERMGDTRTMKARARRKESWHYQPLQ